MSNNLTLLRNTSAFSDGFFGRALSSGVYVAPSAADSHIAKTAGVTFGTGTVEAWVKVTSSSGIYVAFGHGGRFWVGIEDGYLRANYGSVNTKTSFYLGDGQWHHIAIVFNSGVGSVYADGNRVFNGSKSSYGGGDGGIYFCVGGFSSYTQFDWSLVGGLVDEVRISTNRRYTAATYTVPETIFWGDSTTTAVWHLEDSHIDSAVGQGYSISHNDPNIIYSPYTWHIDGNRALTNTGGYFKALIDDAGGDIWCKFDISTTVPPRPQVAIRVDGGPWQIRNATYFVQAEIPVESAGWSEHLVEVMVKSTTEALNRWDSPYKTAVKFFGFDVVSGASSSPGLYPKSKSMLIYGDSITEGTNTLTKSGDATVRNHSQLSYAYQLGEQLGCEVGIVGFGGQGLLKSGAGSVPPVTSTYNLIASGLPRDFSDKPDWVVINQGTNDTASSSDFQTAYTNLLNSIISEVGSSSKIFVLIPFNGDYGSSVYINAIANCTNPKQCYFIDTAGMFNTTNSSDGVHPYGYANIGEIAPKLALAIREAIDSKGMFANVSGEAVKITS